MMDTRTSVFIDSPESIENLVAVLQKVLGIRISISSEQDVNFSTYHHPYHYISPDGKWWFTLGHHDWVNDAELLFENYQYWIEVGGSAANGDERVRLSETYAQWVFEKLKTYGHYPLLLVQDLQIKFDEFAPNQPQ